jgi:hypothetical protein
MAYLERVLEAVKDEEWQRFRRTLKSTPTEDKLNNLREWWKDRHPKEVLLFPDLHVAEWTSCTTCVQVDNYLKALARGGQLEHGVNVREAVLWAFNLKVRK